MAYRIKITPRAQRDLACIYSWIEAESSDAARKWYGGLRATIRSLNKLPEQSPVAPEDKTLLHLLYGHKPHIYRIIYRIVEKQKQVEVLHIRHGARAKFNPKDLPRVITSDT